MIATVLGTLLALIGVFWIGCVIAAALMWHRYAWPNQPQCACGRWLLDPEDCGVVLPLLSDDTLHDWQLCSPLREVITERPHP